MRNLGTTILTALATLGLALTLIVGGGAPAQALGPGGQVTVTKGSNCTIKIAGNLTTSNGKYVLLNPLGWLTAGQSSRKATGIYDTDGFRTPNGCKTYTYVNGIYTKQLAEGTTYKINSLTHTTLHTIKR